MEEYKYDVTVIVLTYNPNWDKLKKTLESILIQKYISYEIIVSDDGSHHFDKDLILKYFSQKNEKNYVVLDNKENKGTVKNIKNALQYAKGRYIKLISPGDYFFNEYSLKNAIICLKNNGKLVGFGRAIYYSDDERCKIINEFHPFNTIFYKNCKLLPKKIKEHVMLKNYIKYKDFILGASVLSEKKITEKYIDKISDKVKLAEDMIYVLMVSDKIEIEFINEAFIYYEYGIGVSTDKNNRLFNQVQEDVNNTFNIIKQEHSDLVRYCDYSLMNDRGIKRFFRRLDRKIYIILYGYILGKIENSLFLKKINS